MKGPFGAVVGKCPSSDGNGEVDGGSGGIVKGKRKCRDVAFLVIFIAFWVAMIVNSSFGFNQGNPLRLTYDLDYKGNICNDRHAELDLRELELRYWLNPNVVFQSGLKGSHAQLANARSICLMDCPNPSEDSLIWVCDYPEGDIHLSVDDWIDRNYDYFEDLTPDLRNTSLLLQGPCYPVLFPTVNVYKSCQIITRASNVSLRHWKDMGGVDIMEEIVIDKYIHNSINSLSSVLNRYIADVAKSWPVLIVCGGILPVFLSIIWLLMIHHFVAAMPWITVILFNILVISVTMFYYLKAGWIGNDAISPIIGRHDPYYHVSAREVTHLHVAAIIMTAVMIIAFLSSIAIVRRILTATSVLKVAAKVIEVKALIIFPMIPYAVLAIFYAFWFSAAFHLFSSGRVVQNECRTNCCAYDLKAKRVSCEGCCGYSVQQTPHIAAAILFHLFGCYWATQFFVACSSAIVAGSVASYYWSRGKTSAESPFVSVFSSTKQLIRYSIGSVALGSLIVSLVESIRFILEALRRKLKKASSSTSENWAGRMVFYTSQGCLKCISWIVKSVNRNAYVMIAITGKSFFKASETATELIISNILQIGKVNVIGDVVLFLGKLCVSLASALFGFLMLDAHKYKSTHHKISSPLFPVLVCWSLGYVVASLFFAVVEMSIDTIILSFCQDSELHHGTAQYAHPLLIETLNDQNEMQGVAE